MTIVDERPALCEGCGGHGQIATGVQCPVCKGIGVASAAGLAAWRQSVVDQALASVRRQLVGGGTAAVTDWLREGAQARQEAQQAALRATLAADEARAHAAAPHAEAQAVLSEARAVLARADALVTAPAALPPGAPAAFIPPDPTDPPPGAPIPPGFGAGDIFYFDSILARQVDVWGQLNTVAGTSQVQQVTVAPSGDTSGAADVTALNNAINSLTGAATPGGNILLTAGTYYLNATISLPWYVHVRGLGWATTINYLANASCIFVQDTSNPQGGTIGSRHYIYGGIHDLVIDGTGAGTNAILLDLQDLWAGYEVDNVLVRNATGASAIGCRMANNLSSINQIQGKLAAIECTFCVVFDTIGAASPASEHINMFLFIYVDTGQTGMYLRNGTQLQGCDLKVKIKSVPAAGPCILMDANSAFQTCNFLFKAELASAATTAQTIHYNSTTAVNFTNCRGLLFFSSNYIFSNITTQKFAFDGEVINDTNLIANQVSPQYSGNSHSVITTPAIPASGTVITNNTLTSVLVYFVGGTFTGATQINGVNVGNAGTTPIFLPIDGTIKLTYSAAPTSWLWVPIGE